MAKKDRKINRQLRDAGWVLVSQSNHEKWHCPCGEHLIVKSSTVGGGRGQANFRSLMRRQGDCSVDLKLG